MVNFDLLDLTWIILTVVFFYFCVLFWNYSRMPLRQFIFRNRGWGDSSEGESSLEEELPSVFLSDLEGFINSINHTNSIRFRLGSVGFFIAGMLSLVSLFLTN